MEDKKTPIGVKVISIFILVLSIVAILESIVAILEVLSIPLDIIAVSDILPNVFLTGDAWTDIILMFPVFLGGIFGIFVSKGIWKGKNWARIWSIIFSIIIIITSLRYFRGNYGTNLFLSSVSCLILFTYLLNKKVKEFFRK